MKKLLFAAALSILSTAATAADMRLPYKAPPPAALWTGFYAGLHGGASWGSKSFDYNDFTPGAPFVWESSIPVNGGLAGGQLGYNLQFGSWLIGVEADASWADI